MKVKELLGRLEELGITVSINGDRLRLEPGSKVPRQLAEALRKNKSEVLAFLRARPDTLQSRYCFTCPGLDEHRDIELTQISQVLAEQGMVLLWSTELGDFIAFYTSEADLEKVPPGFVPYSSHELWELFGNSKSTLSKNGLLLIHQAKKLGAHVVRTQERNPHERR